MQSVRDKSQSHRKPIFDNGENREEPPIVKNIGVDTGGTFTDIVMRINGDLFTHKVLSTPQNPAHAVIQGVREIMGGVSNPDVSTERLENVGGVDIVGGVSNPDVSTDTENVEGVDIVGGVSNPDVSTDAEQLEIVHGSTVGTNALLERRGARIALITTKGFEDILEIGRQARPSLYDFFVQRPAPLVPADRTFRYIGTDATHRRNPDGD